MGMISPGMALRLKGNLQKKTNKKSVKCVELKKMWWVVGYKLTDYCISQSQGDIETGAMMRKIS